MQDPSEEENVNCSYCFSRQVLQEPERSVERPAHTQGYQGSEGGQEGNQEGQECQQMGRAICLQVLGQSERCLQVWHVYSCGLSLLGCHQAFAQGHTGGNHLSGSQEAGSMVPSHGALAFSLSHLSAVGSRWSLVSLILKSLCVVIRKGLVAASAGS